MANIFNKVTSAPKGSGKKTDEPQMQASYRQTDAFSSEMAKAELEKRIAEKLSRMSETDLEELFHLHEDQVRAKKMLAKNHAGRSRAVMDGQISFVEEKEEAPPAPKPGKPERAVAKKTFSAIGAAAQRVFLPVRAAAARIGSRLFPKKPRRGRRSRRARFVLLNYKRHIKRRERKVSARMASLISRMDKRNNRLARVTYKAAVKSSRGVYAAREWADTNKTKLVAGLVVLIAAAVTSVSTMNYFTAYVYAYNGRPLGMVKNQEDVLRVLEVVSEQLTREYGAEIEIDKDQDITFERVYTGNKEIDDMQEVFNRLTYMQDMNAKACGLYIDNHRVAILDTEEKARELVETYMEIQAPQSDNVRYDDRSFAENVEYKQIDTQLGKIQNPDDVIERLLTGNTEQKIHFVEKGETFSGIAKMYNMTQSELEVENPEITPAKLSIGQEIVLTQAVPLLTVQTVEVATYPDIIPYDTIYEDSTGLYKGEQSTKVKGVDGERVVTAKIIRRNGFEIAREEISSETIKAASSAVVVRGTKDLPPLQGTGKLKYPVSGYRLTSKFGSRSGRMHYGIDLACKSGTRIGAADGGTVTFAGYKSSFGYMIIINHGRNMETLYAHCSALFVKKGEKVYQGQHIANVGSTGRSTGPHCHFEVHINGVPKNPLSYL
ncbi:MAG: peptidoglycan DD-metalloendopeptidase family protein [Clostridiales bacterium]|nr:peptidoglycan DD-metalloendopeptidase family protein [Clostridiales bacterium]